MFRGNLPSLILHFVLHLDNQQMLLCFGRFSRCKKVASSQMGKFSFGFSARKNNEL